MTSTVNLTTWSNITIGDILDGGLVIAVRTAKIPRESNVRVQYSDLTWSPWQFAETPVSIYR